MSAIERYEGRIEALDAIAAFLDSKHTPDGLLERAVILDKIADLRSRNRAALAVDRRHAEDDARAGDSILTPGLLAKAMDGWFSDGTEDWRLVPMTADGGLSVTSPASWLAEVVAAEYDRLAREDDSPLGHGTPVPEEATLPSGDARVAGL